MSVSDADGMMQIITDERDILAFALQEARSCGDADPELIQHTIGTREAATKTTGSWVHDDALSYLIAIRGRFSVRVRQPPAMSRDRATEMVRFSVLVRVVDIATGRVTDCGGSNDYPDLGSVGPVVTDHPTHLRGRIEADRSPAPATRAGSLDPSSRTLPNLMPHAGQEAAEFRYLGRIAVGSPGRAHLLDRGAGISELIWDALERAGRIGHTIGMKPTLDVLIRVPPAPTPVSPRPPGAALRPGGPRRRGEHGPRSEDGSARQQRVGPVHGRAVPGLRLLEGAVRAEDFDDLEDMLYTAAAKAGWLATDDDQHAVEVPDAEILIRITRRT